MTNKTFSIPKSNIGINNNYTLIDGFQQAVHAANRINNEGVVKTNFATINTVRYFKEKRCNSYDQYPLDFNCNNYIKINEKTEIYTSVSQDFNGIPHFIGFVFEKSAEEVCTCDSCGGTGQSQVNKILCESCGGNGHFVNCVLVGVKPRFYIKETKVSDSSKTISTFKRSKTNLDKKQINTFLEKITTKLNIDAF
jgi:hypothetical protein